MYEKFYGLKEKPFNILPDPDYLFMSKGHENAYTHLEYAILESKGFVVVTGEIGSGKTTLINYLISKIEQQVQIGLINQTYVTPTQFVKMVCQDFELNTDGMDKAEMVDVLHEYLLKQFSLKERVILIIDEAQNLTPKTMEELRMLSNLEAEKHHLIQMILVGQPELKLKLQRKDLIQFSQRVTVNCHLNGMSSNEVTQYIQYRLKTAGAASVDIFAKDAIESVSKYSHGIPRLINVLCDAALVYGFADGIKTISKDVIKHVISEREEGGLFQDVRRSDGVAPLMTEGEVSDNALLRNQIQDVTRRVRLLENRIDHLDQRLMLLTKSREERDMVVIELFKMLKDSMQKRLKTLVDIQTHRHRVD